MANNVQVTKTDLSSRPFQLKCERKMAASPQMLFPAWTTEEIGRLVRGPGHRMDETRGIGGTQVEPVMSALFFG